MDIKQELKKIINEKPYHYTTLIKKNAKLIDALNIKFPGLTLVEQIYCYVNNTTNLCEYNNKMKFNSMFKGYNSCCVDNTTCRCYKERQSKSVTNAKSKTTKDEQRIIHEKRVITNIERYGVDHYAKTKEYKKRAKETSLNKFGVDSYSKTNEFKKRDYEQYYDNICNRVDHKCTPLFTLDEYKGTEVNKKGILYPWKCNICDNSFEDNIINGHIPRCPICYPHNQSKWELEIQEYIKQYIDIQTNTKQVINPLELDIYIPNKNIAIECNGSYWHSELGGKDSTYHLNKTELCKELNIQLLHIWEHEYNNNPELIKSIINAKLGLNDKIYARKTQIQVVDNKTKELFLDNNHLQGTCASKHNIGLYRNNELIALMTFGNPRFNKKYEWELIRYCSKQNINVIGGASKLFKHFIRNYKPNNVISYADRRYSNGNMYKQLGFEFIENSSPNFKYTKDYKTMYNRIQFQKHKLSKKLDIFDSNLTEKQNMINNGYARLWDCGNSVWKWNNK